MGLNRIGTNCEKRRGSEEDSSGAQRLLLNKDSSSDALFKSVSHVSVWCEPPGFKSQQWRNF